MQINWNNTVDFSVSDARNVDDEGYEMLIEFI